MSTKIEGVLEELLFDWNAVSEFLNDPEDALASTGLSVEETAALLDQDEKKLAVMGIDRELVSAALSGAHSQTCPV